LAIYYFEKAIEKNNDFKEEAAKICYEQAKELLKNEENFYDGLGLLNKAIQFNPILLSSVSSYCIKIANKEFENSNVEKSFSLLELATDPSINLEKNSLLIKIGFKQWKDGNHSFSKKCLQMAKESGANFENSDSLYYAFHIDLAGSNINIDMIDKFFNLFPESSYLPELVWKKANFYFLNASLEKSKKALNELLVKYHKSKFAQLAQKRLGFWPNSLVIVSSSNKWVNLGLPDVHDMSGIVFVNKGNTAIKFRFANNEITYIPAKQANFLYFIDNLSKAEAQLEKGSNSCLLESYLKTDNVHWKGKEILINSMNWVDTGYKPSVGTTLIIENNGQSTIEARCNKGNINDRILKIEPGKISGFAAWREMDNFIETIKVRNLVNGSQNKIIMVEFPCE